MSGWYGLQSPDATRPQPAACVRLTVASTVARVSESPARQASTRYVNIARMPKLTVEGFPTVDVEDRKRLVNAIEKDAGVDILHACGGNARCTTCRVEFVAGEPAHMTRAEKTRLSEKGLTGVRLSCQIECDHDMTVRAISRLTGSGRPDPGSTPLDTIQPPPEWI